MWHVDFMHLMKLQDNKIGLFFWLKDVFSIFYSLILICSKRFSKPVSVKIIEPPAWSNSFLVLEIGALVLSSNVLRARKSKNSVRLKDFSFGRMKELCMASYSSSSLLQILQGYSWVLHSAEKSWWSWSRGRIEPFQSPLRGSQISLKLTLQSMQIWTMVCAFQQLFQSVISVLFKNPLWYWTYCYTLKYLEARQRSSFGHQADLPGTWAFH